MATTNKTQWAHGKHLPAQYNNETGVYGPLACGHYDIVADTVGHSCNSEVTRADQIANARLIARAPELLKIVEFLAEWVKAGADVVPLSALFNQDDGGLYVGDYTLADAVWDALKHH